MKEAMNTGEEVVESKEYLEASDVAPYGWVRLCAVGRFVPEHERLCIVVGDSCYVPAKKQKPRTWTGTVQQLWNDKHDVLGWPDNLSVTVTEVVQ